jgi:glutamyl-tRNA reductase
MLDGYHVLTLTHRDAPLETIGRFMVPADQTGPVLGALKARLGWNELFYLATCNRVMYLFYDQSPVEENIKSRVLNIIRPDMPASEAAQLAGQLRLLHGADAIRHLFEVGGSLDSLVVGEREIIRQLREAYDHSHALGLTGDHIRLLMRFSIETAKEIYSTTAIGEKALSVVALAFSEMQKTVTSKNARILMVGAGQTNALFARFLAKKGFHHVTILNRTPEKAAVLAGTFDHGRAFPLDVLEYWSEGFDALVVCTGSTEPVVTPDVYHSLVAGDKTRKTVVDLSVPNNVDKRMLAEYPVHFIEIEALRATAEQNRSHREHEKTKADTIITRRLYEYRALWHERQVERSLAYIPDEVRAVKERAVQEVYAKDFAQLDPAAQELVMKMLGYMEKKCVAIPIKAAKSIALHALKQQGGRAERSPAIPLERDTGR